MNRWSSMVLGILVGGVFALPQTAQSMPNFARRAGIACEGCHTTIPRLNENGFNFRKAGFRNPDEIGKDAGIEFKDTFAARIQARLDSKHRKDPGPSGTTKTDTNQLTLHEITLYPLSSAFGSHYASLMELSVANEDFLELENAYFRYAGGTSKAFWSARAGIFHPFEGYGASDRPYSLSRPFIQTTVTNQVGSTFFTPWNFDEAGLELAYVHGPTSLSATLFNGLVLKDDEGSFKAFPAAGGELTKPTSGFESRNSKDVQLFLNHVLKDDGSGVSLYWYHGYLDLPVRSALDPADFSPDSSFQNKFDRGALYGSWALTPKLVVQGAFQVGRDHLYDLVAGATDGTYYSRGWFAEADAPVSDHLTLGARYDVFDPSDSKVDNVKTGITAFGNFPMNDGLQGIAEFQHVQTERAGRDDLKDDNFQLRVIWIW